MLAFPSKGSTPSCSLLLIQYDFNRNNLDLCADHFLIEVNTAPLNDVLNQISDPVRALKRIDLADKLINNYHLVEIDANDIPNEWQAMEIFYDRIRDAEEGDCFEEVEGTAAL